MRKQLLINILWVIIAVLFIVYFVSVSEKRDAVNGIKWDDCINNYKSQPIPASAYETYMRHCMNNK